MTQEEYARRSEAEWTEWWWARFRDAARDLSPADGSSPPWTPPRLDEGASFPTLDIPTPAGVVSLYERDNHLLNIDWPNGSVGRAWAEVVDDKLVYILSPPGCYALRLQPTEHFTELVETIYMLADWGVYEFSGRAQIRGKWRRLSSWWFTRPWYQRLLAWWYGRR